MTPTRIKDAVLPSDARVAACGNDPRVLAAMIAQGQLPEVDRVAGLASDYEARLAACGNDPRVLVSAAENPEVAAMFGLNV